MTLLPPPHNDWLTEKLLRNSKTRLFWDVEFDPPLNAGAPLGTSTTIRISGPVVGMVIEEVRHSWYRAFAAAWHQISTRRHNPSWDDASKFVHQYIMPNAKYAKGDIMLTGFWTPDEEKPWLLPFEPEYVDHINQV